MNGDDLGLGVPVPRVRCPVPRPEAGASCSDRFEALRVAFEAGDAETIRQRLRETLDAALADALARGHLAVAQVLVDHGARSGRRTFDETFRR